MPDTGTHYDLVLKGGRILDPANQLDAVTDIGVNDGHIAAIGTIAAERGRESVDCSGKLVTPGFIDGHVHFYASGHGGLESADEPGSKAGAATVIDGGSSGYLTFPDFKARHLVPPVTDAYCYLHHNPAGQITLPELWGPKLKVDYARIRETIRENRRYIVALKDRAVGAFVQGMGIEGVEKARQVCSDCGIPYAMHIGLELNDTVPDRELNAFTRDVLRMLAPGDILTHACTGKRGHIFREDGLFDREIRDAYERGVVFDCSNGVLNFSAESFRTGRERGFLPHILATDNSPWGTRETVRNLGVVMSKFLALGVPLDRLVAMVTWNAAQAVGLHTSKGRLDVGRQADITVTELERGDYRFLDHLHGEVLFGDTLMVPRLTIIRGVIYPTVNVGGPTMPEFQGMP